MAVYLRRTSLILSRRSVIVGTGALIAAPAMALSPRQPTPPQMEGPFYPRIKPLDSDADLTLMKGANGKAAGEVIELTGRVVSAGGPVQGAIVEIWQADHFGRYHHVRDGLANERDANFQGYGAVKADGQGNYRFRTIKPRWYEIGPDARRTPHIHVQVVTDDRTALTTQMYFPGEPMNEGDFIYQELDSDAARYAATAKADPGDASKFTFDIVLLI